ncbi:N-acyl-D-amino-acid deacylase family protein [Microlunatus speluncae]|uniref:N-acyl-D-amino-acid deacylase family protein n=1 Tax=Microlunatus speluncae TaxID=2594267 RepID=UPI0012664BFA|nr:D-aminoacylase [Microlunatus speluncae]
MTELLITGGSLLDGTDGPARTAELLIKDDRIAAVLPAGTEVAGAERLEARGQIVAPGFIDVHTHSDVSVLLDGRAESKLHQGVTTEVIGNCGFSPYPLTAAHRRDQLDLLAGIGDDPIEADWTDLDGYAAVFAERGVAINVAPLVGHGQLRIAAAGLAPELDADQLRTGQRLLAELLDQGAFGMSTGLTYLPSRFAGTAELVGLCRILRRSDALYATHARDEGPESIEEAAALGATTGVRVQYSHLAINHPDHWGEAADLVARFDRHRAAGVDLAYDVYPYDASASALTQYLPAWVQAGGIAAMTSRLAEPATRRRAADELARGWGRGVPWLWDRVILSRTDGLVGAREGLTVAEAAAELNVAEPELVLELCRAGGNRVQVVLRYRTEQDMRTFLRQPYALIGSDGSALPYRIDRQPHPRAYGAHARVLGRYVRDLGDLSLGAAIHRLTGAAADRIGITDRGRLRPGLAADVVIFDPATVADRATFLEPAQPPVGIRQVLVNGAPVIRDGRQTPARPGRVLRRG